MMTNDLQAMIERARGITMSAAEKEAQRRSFAYGNTRIENRNITRDTVDSQAEALAGVDGGR